MLSGCKLLPNLISSRCLFTSVRLDFKFKLTEEMSREYERKQEDKRLKELPPEQAIHTRESSLIMGRVSSDRYEQVVKVGVPKHRLNPAFLLYIKEHDDVHAHDEKNVTKPGDWVLLRRQQNPVDEKVVFKIERVVYSYGNYIDPITGRRSLGLYHDDDMERWEKIKVE